jgi:hypothetical protein
MRRASVTRSYRALDARRLSASTKTALETPVKVTSEASCSLSKGGDEMTTKQLETAKAEALAKVDLVHGTALKIRALLDEARKAYGATGWDDDDCESKVLELVTDEPG